MMDAANPSSGTAPGKLQHAASRTTSFGKGALFSFEHAELEALFLTPRILRLSWSPGTEPIPYALASSTWPGGKCSLHRKEEGFLLSGSHLSLHVASNGSVEHMTSNGNRLRHEDPPLVQGAGWRQRAAFEKLLGAHGLGLRAGLLDLCPGRYALWNRDPGGSYGPGCDPLYLCIPVLLMRHRAAAQLVFFENPYPGWIELTKDRCGMHVSFTQGMLRQYTCFGSLPEALSGYAELTGRPPLPPRWALGFHQSRWGYSSQEEVERVAKGFERRSLPLAAIHLDIDHLEGYRIFTTDPERFADVRDLAGRLQEGSVRLVSIVDPGVKAEPSFSLNQSGQKRDVFCRRASGRLLQARVWPGWCHFPDFTSRQARSWWSEQYERLLELGISGFWHDMNEPAAFVELGEPTLPLSVRHHMEGRGGDHREAHNLYGLLMAQAGFEGLRRLSPHTRPWLLSRSGWAGIQRFAWHWTGDIESTWQALQQTVASVLNLGLSGVPFTGPDIGGFSGNPSPELFVRWLQLATFLPFFRSHSAWNTERREPWLFEEPVFGIIAAFLRLRSRLLPYLYTLAWEACRTGWPLVRPVFWHSNEAAQSNPDESRFLLGPSLLVAPVLRESERSREVRLPEGGWYDFWTDALWSGPATVQAEAPLERIPVFVAEGSVLPLEKAGDLELHVYPPREAAAGMSSHLYSDTGEGFAPGRLDRFSFDPVRKGGRLSWQSEGDAALPYTSIRTVLHGLQPERILLDGREIAASRGFLSGAFSLLEWE